ncbi:hypothetical protein IWQ61_008323, partial [Dispira simplex]
MDSLSSSSPPFPPSSPDYPHLPAYLSPSRDIPEAPLTSMDLTNPTVKTAQGTWGRSASFAEWYTTSTVAPPFHEVEFNSPSWTTPTGPVPQTLSNDHETPHASHSALHRFTSQFGSTDPFASGVGGFTRSQSWQTGLLFTPSNQRTNSPLYSSPHTPKPLDGTTGFPPTPDSIAHQSPLRHLSHLTQLSSPTSTVTPLSHSTSTSGRVYPLDDRDMDVDTLYPGHQPRLGGMRSLGRRTRSHYVNSTSHYDVSATRLKRKLLFDDCSNNDPNINKQEDHSRATQTAVQRIRELVDHGHQSTVDLSDLDLVQVPEEISELQHVVIFSQNATFDTHLKMYLNNNLVTQLPTYFFNLQNLTVLILSSNKLTRVPPEIRQLCNLRELSLGSNRLRFLPSEILSLPHLHLLNLYPNPLLPSPSAEQAEPVPCPTDALSIVHSDVARICSPELIVYPPASSSKGSQHNPTHCPFDHLASVLPPTEAPEALVYRYGVPRLVDLAARTIVDHEHTLFDSPEYTSHSAVVNINGRPQGQSPCTKRRRPPSLALDSHSVYPRKTWLPIHLQEILGAVATNRCAVCDTPFVIPYLVELVWLRVCDNARVPLLFR